ncbi:hypothetical protein V8G54_027588 [Vigna mungo]|uniref:Uncharacterized protein n=1 Tax=Vigna mungo TaxID=3915 RepID=A0AAQ3RR56_VIGMU
MDFGPEIRFGGKRISNGVETGKVFQMRVGLWVGTIRARPDPLPSLGEAMVEEDWYVFELGDVDVILGIAWLAKLGEVVINWRDMSMAYVSEGKVRVQGDPALSRQLVNPQALLKLVDAESWVLVWDLGQLKQGETVIGRAHHLVFRERENLPPLCEKVELWSVLQTHYLGFWERENLPPLCDIKHHYRKKFETWKLGLSERKKIMAKRDLETGSGKTKNNRTEENYTGHESSNI